MIVAVVEDSDYDENIYLSRGNITMVKDDYLPYNVNQPLLSPYGYKYRPNDNDVCSVTPNGIDWCRDIRLLPFAEELEKGSSLLQSNDYAIVLGEDINISGEKTETIISKDTISTKFVDRDDDGKIEETVSSLVHKIDSLKLLLKDSDEMHLTFAEPLIDILDAIVDEFSVVASTLNSHIHPATMGVTSPTVTPYTPSLYFSLQYPTEKEKVKTNV